MENDHVRTHDFLIVIVGINVLSLHTPHGESTLFKKSFIINYKYSTTNTIHIINTIHI